MYRFLNKPVTLLIGANIDAVETASKYGIESDRAVNYNADSQGTRIVYDTLSEAVCTIRERKPLSKSWSESIQADFEKRGK